MRPLHGRIGGNAAATLHDTFDLHCVLEARIAASGSLSAFCREHGLSVSYVSMVRHAHREYSPELLKVLGFRKLVRFEPIPSE